VHLDDQPLGGHASGDLAPPRARVLGHVGQRLGDGEVGGRLDRGGQPVGHVDRHRARHRAARGERGDRGVEPAVGEDRGVDPAGEVAQLGERDLGVLVRAGQQLRGGLRIGLDPLARHPEVHRQRDETGLRAVVQVALDPAQLDGGGVDRAGATPAAR
jgi:hypothetical protein